MAGGLAAGLARGLSTGYGMARDAYQDEQTQKRQAVEDVYRARADERADQASKRENERLELMRTTEQRQQQRLDETERQQRLALATTALKESIADLEVTAKARQLQNMPVDPEDEKRYGESQAQLRAARQESINFFTRVQGRQMSLDDAPPKDLYLHWVRATGMTLQEMAQMPQHIKDIQDGLQYRNDDLQIQGINGLLGPTYLKRGIGEPSPYGGTITKKEVVRLVPARDANGVDHPDKVYPILRVYTDQMGPDGQPLYYDAAMTRDGTTAENDEIVPISLKRGFDFMGNMGTLAELMKRPEIAKRLEQGEKEGGAEARKYIEDLRARSRPTKKVVTRERVDLGDKYLEREVDETGKILSEKELRKGAVPRVFAPPRAGGAGGVSSVLDNLEEPTATGEDLLAQLPPRVAATIRGLDEGRMTLKDLPTKGNYRGEMQALWNQYNSGADATKFTTSQRVENAFAVGKQGDTVRSFNVAVEHLDTLNHLIGALKNSDMLTFNKLANEIAKQTGQAAPTNFESARQIVTNEVTKATVGAQNALGDRQEIARTINVASSPEQLQGAIKNYQELMAGQLKGLGTQYYAGGGRKDFSRFLTPRTVELTGGVPRPAGAVQTAIRGGPARMPTFGSEADAAAAAKAGKIKPGDRITINGQTGTWQ